MKFVYAGMLAKGMQLNKRTANKISPRLLVQPQDEVRRASLNAAYLGHIQLGSHLLFF